MRRRWEGGGGGEGRAGENGGGGGSERLLLCVKGIRMKEIRMDPKILLCVCRIALAL